MKDGCIGPESSCMHQACHLLCLEGFAIPMTVCWGLLHVIPCVMHAVSSNKSIGEESLLIHGLCCWCQRCNHVVTCMLPQLSASLDKQLT